MIFFFLNAQNSWLKLMHYDMCLYLAHNNMTNKANGGVVSKTGVCFQKGGRRGTGVEGDKRADARAASAARN